MSARTAPAACGWTHESDMARAVDRFNPDSSGYRARCGGPLRATRAEAEMDECEAKHKPYCDDLCPFRACSDDCPGAPREEP